MSNFLERNKFVLKLTVSSVLLFFILKTINFSQLKELILHMNLTFASLAAAIVFFGIFVSSFKWQILLKEQNLNISFGKALYAYYSGSFFNNFFPTTVGGDFIRAKLVGSDFGKSLISTIFDRYLGVVALSSFALMGAFFSLKSGHPKEIVILGLGLFLITLSSSIFFFFTNGMAHIEGFLIKRFSFLHKYCRVLMDYRTFSKRIVWSIALSFIFQFLSILYIFFIIKALGVDVDFWYVFLIVPIITIFLMLPISINGIGLREVVFVFFLASIGIDASAAVAVSFISFVILTLVSSGGGVAFLLSYR